MKNKLYNIQQKIVETFTTGGDVVTLIKLLDKLDKQYYDNFQDMIFESQKELLFEGPSVPLLRLVSNNKSDRGIK